MKNPHFKVNCDSWEVPDCSSLMLAPKRNRYCVIVFVLNEGERIRRQLKKMWPIVSETGFDLIVADGGSTDDSLSEDLLASTGVRCLLTKKGEGALSAQMRMALSWALLEGYEGVVVVDGNDKDDTRALWRFKAALEQGYDHVQGSRHVVGGKAVNTPKLRHLSSKLIHAPLISMAARKWHTDTTNGFRAYSRRLLEDPELAIFRNKFDRYQLHYFLDIEACRHPYYRTCEIPVTRVYPRAGSTPTKISGIKGNTSLLLQLLGVVLGLYRRRNSQFSR